MSALTQKYPIFTIRYLDSLDSIRYNNNELFFTDNRKFQRAGQALIEVCTTLLMGNGIIVSPNQLIDSYGFLRIASEMIKAAQKVRKEETVPIYYSHYDYRHEFSGESPIKTPSLLVKHLFSKTDYELSSFPDCKDRRLKWAERFGNDEEVYIPDSMVIDDDERQLTNDLAIVINFFEKHPEKINTAGSVKNIRTNLAFKISELDKEKLENDCFLSKLITNENRYILFSNIISIFNKIYGIRDTNGKQIIDNRSKVRAELSNALVNDQKRIFRDIEGSPVKACMGVLKAIDIIYNHSMYLASSMDTEKPHAQQENITEPNDILNWSYDEASYALGNWVRQDKKDRIMNRQSCLSANSSFSQNKETINYSFIKNDFDEFWQYFFNFQQSDDFINSINRYQSAFELLRLIKSSLPQEKTKTWISQFKNTKEAYNITREYHIDLLNEKYLKKYCYRIETEGNEKKLVHYNNENISDLKIRIEDFSEDADISLDFGSDVDNNQGKGKVYSD